MKISTAISNICSVDIKQQVSIWNENLSDPLPLHQKGNFGSDTAALLLLASADNPEFVSTSYKTGSVTRNKEGKIHNS